MRVVMLGLALAVLIARPAGAGRMLYATAASDDRIDGFCLFADGTIKSTPDVRLELPNEGTQPRRLVVANGFNGVTDDVDDVLYVVTAEEVQAFKIGPKGGLSQAKCSNAQPGAACFLGQTKTRRRSGPRDIAIWSPPPPTPESPPETPRMLYVPDRSLSRVVGHPLDPVSGAPASDYTTCIQSRLGASLQSLLVNRDATGDKLYVSSSSGSGRIEVYEIRNDGRLVGAENPPLPLDTPLDQICGSSNTDPDKKRSEPTEPLSERRKIFDVKSFVIAPNLAGNNILYAEDRGRRRIRAFELTNGNFQAPTPDPKPNRPDKVIWQPATFKTGRVANYQQILHFRNAILGTQFFRGRIDSYALDAATGDFLDKQGTKLSEADLRLTPVRLIAANNLDGGGGATVYVAAGEFDRIIAYRLGSSGALREKEPFSQTDEQDDSFPNDVAIAMLPDGCP